MVLDAQKSDDEKQMLDNEIMNNDRTVLLR